MTVLDDGEIAIPPSQDDSDNTISGKERFASFKSSTDRHDHGPGLSDPMSCERAGIQNQNFSGASGGANSNSAIASSSGSLLPPLSHLSPLSKLRALYTIDPVLGPAYFSKNSLQNNFQNGLENNMMSPSTIVITDELLQNYQRCQRRAFLDEYSDIAHRDPISDYVWKLQHDSLIHQTKVLSAYSAQRPHYPAKDWNAGFEATLDLIKEGVEYIERGVLQVRCVDSTTSTPVIFIGRPKLLIRRPGQSIFGPWVYIATDIKLGKRPKADYQIGATFHAYLLAHIQRQWPESSHLILRYNRKYEVSLADQLPKFEEILVDCLTMMQKRQEPAVFISRNRCDLCHWFSHCYSIAQEEEHLSLLPGVTPSRYTHLKKSNLTTVKALAHATASFLSSLPGFGQQTAYRLVRQAQSTYYNKALKLDPQAHGKLDHPPLHRWIPTAPVELYFDIESAPEGLIYLHGIVVVDRNNDTETFYGLMATQPEEEEIIWQQFLDLTVRYPAAPIFHFCPYEVQTVKKLGEMYGTPQLVIDSLVQRFVDLHDRVVQTVVLPIESYALKAIARWVGFEWRDAQANGAQSIFWYDQWIETGDRTYLNHILCYNEDDCRATWKVKDWLVEFLQE